jgi:chromosome segregation ATPase
MPRRRITSVKTPKKPSKEPSLPSQDESRRTNVLLEKLMSEFRTFGESLSIVRDRVDRMEPDVRQMKDDMQLMKLVSDTVRENLRTIKTDVALHSGDLRTIKSDVAEIKADLKSYNQRLEVVEAKIAS